MQKWSAAQRSDDYLSHFFTVGLGIQGNLGQQDGVFPRRNPEFVIERTMPNLQKENHFRKLKKLKKLSENWKSFLLYTEIQRKLFKQSLSNFIFLLKTY